MHHQERLDAMPLGDAANRRLASRERTNARGDETRLLLLETAERLFAERGIRAVPLRDIGIAAGQRNHAAVQYHFGTRDSLIKEIIRYRAASSEADRNEMLADLMTKGQPQVSELVGIYVLPLSTHLVAGDHYLAFMSRVIIEHGGYAGLENALPTATAKTLRTLLGRLLPACPAEVLDERWTTVLTSSVHALARYQQVMMSGTLPLPLDWLLADLVRFLTGGVQASFEAPDYPTGAHRAILDGRKPTGRRTRARVAPPH
jgi:AcrR family transcriptional regulator